MAEMNGLFDGLVPKGCPHCGGSGFVYDDRELGERLRRRRLALDLTLRQVGDLLGFTHSYIWDLEAGLRRWSPELVVSYMRATEG